MQSHPEAYDSIASEHHAGEGYSGKNKIPTIGQLLDRQKKKGNDPSAQENMTAGQLEKQEEMDKANAGKGNPAKDFKAKGEREVRDPVTGRMVTIKDAELEDYHNQRLFAKDALDPSKSTAGPATNLPSGQGLKGGANDQGSGEGGLAPINATNPVPVEPSNILLQQFPPPYADNTMAPIVSDLNKYAFAIMAALGLIWAFVAFGSGYKAFMVRSSLLGGLAVSIFVAHGIIGRKIEKELERVRLDLLKQRGEKFSPPTPESVEWLNSFTKCVWPLVPPQLFASIVDMIEDVMQQSLPGFIDAVKVDDFTIGKNALRIVAMRALPDQPHEKDYPKEEWIDQGSNEHALDPARKEKSADAKKAEDQVIARDSAEPDEDQTGDYVNFEVSFAYFAPPGTKKLQGENISLMIRFYLGLYDWIHVPVPLWIAVESIVGTVRLRCQMVPQAPFIRNLTFTLMGVPSIEASAIPMTRALPNVLDLPMVSGFVKSSIAAACDVYVAPKSMTMNMAQMLSGDGIKKDTKGLGVLCVTIHSAKDLSAQDDNGYSDPYVVLAFAKFGKPLFSTRIITQDLNPVWEQTAFLIVSDDEVKAQEELSVQLWDSDAFSADDLVGRIKVPLIDLMLKPNEMFRRTDKLMGFEDQDEMSGELTWSVGYYDKVKLNPALKKEAGIDHNLPKELQDRPELKVEATAADTAEEADVQRTPPDPRYPSGMLSVVVHQINNLERQNLKGATGDREGQAGQDTDAPSEQSDNLPSAYCEIIVNDDMIYKTRVKQYTTMPFFEAGTETFIRDWQKTSLRVVVRDSRLREHDPILGVINLPLDKILAHSSEVTRLFSLVDGVGFGRVNISILFKGVALDLPRNMKGWDTGTICIKGKVKVEPVKDVDFNFKEKKMVLSTSQAEEKLSSSSANLTDEGILEYDVEPEVRLPTYDRYGSALYFTYGGGLTVGPLGKKQDAVGALWLHELIDDVAMEVRVPIVVGKNMPTLKQTFINETASKTHEYQIVGWAVATVVLDSGLDEDHEKYAKEQSTTRHAFEAYDRVEGQAKQAEENSHANDDGVIDRQERKKLDRAHKKALESRERGVMQFKAARTAKWTKDGMKDRAKGLVNKITGNTPTERTVASEA